MVLASFLLGTFLVVAAPSPLGQVVPITGIPVEHPRPDPIIYAADYLAMQDSYLGIGTFETKDRVKLEEARTVQALAQAEPKYGPTRGLKPPPDNYLTEDEVRLLAASVFEPEHVDLMVRVAWCESRWNTSAKSSISSAAGLWQHLRAWYSGAWGITGVFDPYDPEQSARAAAALLYETASGIGNWLPSRHCWG